ncbi:MAG: hypothetical protein JWP04_3587 [Belnapia sp.]|nr:hypothetical protein [Belnapia sp.]
MDTAASLPPPVASPAAPPPRPRDTAAGSGFAGVLRRMEQPAVAGSATNAAVVGEAGAAPAGGGSDAGPAAGMAGPQAASAGTQNGASQGGGTQAPGSVSRDMRLAASQATGLAKPGDGAPPNGPDPVPRLPAVSPLAAALPAGQRPEGVAKGAETAAASAKPQGAGGPAPAAALPRPLPGLAPEPAGGALAATSAQTPGLVLDGTAAGEVSAEERQDPVLPMADPTAGLPAGPFQPALPQPAWLQAGLGLPGLPPSQASAGPANSGSSSPAAVKADAAASEALRPSQPPLGESSAARVADRSGVPSAAFAAPLGTEEATAGGPGATGPGRLGPAASLTWQAPEPMVGSMIASASAPAPPRTAGGTVARPMVVAASAGQVAAAATAKAAIPTAAMQPEAEPVPVDGQPATAWLKVAPAARPAIGAAMPGQPAEKLRDQPGDPAAVQALGPQVAGQGHFPASAGLSAAPPGTTTAATPPAAYSPPPAPPARQVAQVTIAMALGAGRSPRLLVALEPESLGRVEIRIERGADGEAASVRVLAERPETLALLQRDARDLDRALVQAGIALADGAMQFGLTGDDRGSQGQQPASQGNGQGNGQRMGQGPGRHGPGRGFGQGGGSSHGLDPAGRLAALTLSLLDIAV